MKVLTVLKYLVNFIFIAFLISAILMLGMPFFDQSYTHYSTLDVFWILIVFPLIHLFITFMILFYLRKFVHRSDIGAPLDKSTRKYLRLSGIFCLISGFIKIPEVAGIFTYYRVTGDYDTSLLTSDFLNFGSLFYMILIGLFFIYLANVLENSDMIMQENKLTI